MGWGARFYQDPEPPADAPSERAPDNVDTMLRGEYLVHARCLEDGAHA
jgi:hypothetical protein